MTTLTVTARGQVTFRKDVLQHLGIKPGEKIELDLLPGGRGILRAARPAGTIDVVDRVEAENVIDAFAVIQHELIVALLGAVSV